MNAWLTTLAVLAFAVFSFWLVQELEESEVAPRRAAPHEPDYYVDNMVRRTLGVDGSLRNVLRATRVEHFPDDDLT